MCSSCVQLMDPFRPSALHYFSDCRTEKRTNKQYTPLNRRRTCRPPIDVASIPFRVDFITLLLRSVQRISVGESRQIRGKRSRSNIGSRHKQSPVVGFNVLPLRSGFNVPHASIGCIIVRINVYGLSPLVCSFSRRL